MQKIYCLVLSILLCFTSLNSNCQVFEWAKSFGGNSHDLSTAVAVDPSGNVYSAGSYWNTVDFDPGAGNFNLTSNGFSDMYLSRFNAQGDFTGAFGMGGLLPDAASAIAADKHGNIYIAGGFQDTASFYPGLGNLTLISSGGFDMFISKIDSGFSILWTITIGGVNGKAIFVDPNENIYIAGNFTGTRDFDPGPGTYNLISAGAGDVFVCKLDSSGNFVWAGQLGGSTGDAVNSLTADASHVYIAGEANGTGDFDPGTGVYNLNSNNWDGFICKLDSGGNFVWAKNFGGQYGDEISSVCVDTTGNVYLGGKFADIADFDPSPSVYSMTSSGNYDLFFMKLNSAGDFVWAKSIGNSIGDETIENLVLDNYGNLYMTGTFYQTCDLDAGSSVYNLTAAGQYDIFIAMVDQNGMFVWAQQIGGTSTEAIFDLAIDNLSNIYLTGEMIGTVDLNPGTTVMNFTSNGIEDAYIIKLSNTSVSVNENFSAGDLTIYPNPSNGHIFAKSAYPIDEINIINSIGNKIYSGKPNSALVNVPVIEKGLLLVQVYFQGKYSTKKIINQ